MDFIIQEIKNILLTNEDKWIIKPIENEISLTIEDWKFIIPANDSGIKFIKSNVDVTEKVETQKFYTWNGFYRWISMILQNREYKEKFLENILKNKN